MVVLRAGGAQAQSFTLLSQNTLHLGWGLAKPYASTKHSNIKAQIGNSDVALLQEVMKDDTATMALVKPGGWAVQVSHTMRGYGWYRETYAIFYNPAKVTVSDADDYPDTAHDFSRKPYAAQIQVTGYTNKVWVVDFHAIWGKRVGQRRAEAAAMTKVIDWLLAKHLSTKIVIGGDWNLPTGDSGFNALKGRTYTIEPNDASTINTVGGRSSAYDHFASSSGLTVADEEVIDPLTGSESSWRDNVSDHLGVSCTVTP